jgi:hypothetical protein
MSGGLVSTGGTINNPLAGISDARAWVAQAGVGIGSLVQKAFNNANAADLEIGQALEELNVIIADNMDAPPYLPKVDGISFTFVPPSVNPVRGNYLALEPPPVVALPARAGLLTDSASNAIFAKARTQVSRSTAQGAREAFYQGAAGLGMSSGKLHAALIATVQAEREAIVQVANEQATQEGLWAREDIKTIIEMEMKQFTDRWSVTQGRLKAEEDALTGMLAQYEAQLKREQARLGWTHEQVAQIMTEAEQSAKIYIEWGTLTLQQLLAMKQETIKAKAAVFQGWGGMVNANIGFSASLSNGYSFSESRKVT